MGYPFIDIYFGEMSATIGNTSTEVSTNWNFMAKCEVSTNW
jgi:hypothetical protein